MKANIDLETDKIIQSIIINELTSSTIITIAHRLLTVIEYDRIIVLGDGQVIESGSPYELLTLATNSSSSSNNKSSSDSDSASSGSAGAQCIFREMCENSNDLAHLLDLATAKHKREKAAAGL
jgi:ABC-type multidrug transport system ATPase subunit